VETVNPRAVQIGQRRPVLGQRFSQ
jgi:hypothetical protein